MYGTCPKVLLCLRIDEMRLSISYEFYMEEILKTMQIFVKSFDSALLFICMYAMNNTNGLVQHLREVKYFGCTPRVPYLLGCDLRNIIEHIKTTLSSSYSINKHA